jgi:hypothetical protein
MSSTLKRLAAMVAVGTMGLLSPAGASAATSPATDPTKLALPAFPAAGLPTLPEGGVGFLGPSVGAVSSVIGPTIITVGAGVSFVGTTNTTTAGSALVNAGTAGGVGP